MFIPPLRISLSGGGVKGFAHVGALEVLQERGMLKTVREYIGISAGALVATCMCIGCSTSEVRGVIEQLDFGLVRSLEPETVFSFPETFGLDDGEGVRRLITAILRAKGLSPELTFAQLAEHRLAQKLPRLRIFATNLNTCRNDEFNEVSTPDVEVRLALAASMCIPVYFQPVRRPDTGDLYVDGGVISHSPLTFLTEEERATTLSITFSDDHKPKQEIPNLFTFLRQVYYAMDYHYNDLLTRGRPHNVLFLNCGAILSINFELTTEERAEILAAGRRSAEMFLKGQGLAPARRRRFSSP